LYPYSQSVSLSQLTGGHLNGTANYLRNSVKVVVNAYSGAMTYYIADPTDPIVQLWSDVFPALFRPLSDASADLRAHFRYPEDLFTVQAKQFANYHVVDPQVFYGKQDFWQFPGDPTVDVKGGGGQPDLAPYYVQTLVPGAPSEQFQLILPFTPAGRQNMVAWMAASSDPADYGKLVSFEFPAGQNVQGPQQVFNQINSDPQFSSERTLLSRGGSNLVFGNFLVIPINTGFLYVLPVLVEGSQQNAQTFPQLKQVVVFHGTTIGLGTTLDAALANSFGNAPPPPPPNGGGTGSVSDQIKGLLADASQHFQAADAALKAGDLGTYQTEISAAERDIQQAEALANGSSSGGGTTTPTPSSSGGATTAPTTGAGVTTAPTTGAITGPTSG
jgi:uncharacterized membrane protein (UPF0182 family)